MAKLTVYFKNNVIRSYLFDAERVRIGCDEVNDLVIDSPEFAPVHVVIVTRGDNCMIRQLNDDFPLIINGKNTKENKLQHGDRITAGHYDIVYSTNEVNNNAEQTNKFTQSSHKTKPDYIPHTANYQVISGIGLGRIFHLNTPMAMIGEQGSGIVVISKRKDGYFASILENIGTITLNNQPLDDKIIKLNQHDVLAVNKTVVQFYLQ